MPKAATPGQKNGARVRWALREGTLRESIRFRTPTARSHGTMPKDTLTITDNRTGKTYEVPVADGTIRATDLRKIQVDEQDFGLMTYDPGFMNTCSCRSSITF